MKMIFVVSMVLFIILSCSANSSQDSIYGSNDYRQSVNQDSANIYDSEDDNEAFNDNEWIDVFESIDNEKEFADEERCGNGIMDLDEVCDAGSIISCTDVNPDAYYSGNAVCKEDCSGWNLDDCKKTDCWNNDDDPDEFFVDSNCDGIDGDIGSSVFVDVFAGNDNNDGTMLFPVATINKGIAIASQEGKKNVLVGKGLYPETVELSTGISIHGAYSGSPDWKRSVDNIVDVAGGVFGVEGKNVSNVKVSFLNIYSSSFFSEGKSSIAVILSNCSNITFNNVYIESGLGGNGADGQRGDKGVNGERGGDGFSGCENDSFPCSKCSIPTPGKGGNSVCGSNGGDGGIPGVGNNVGSKGEDGTGELTPGGTGGNGGFKGYENNKCGYILNDFSNGNNGVLGANGNNGDRGVALGFFEKESYVPADGRDGKNGYAGSGAGGGGGGKGGSGSAWCDSYGSSGGGGGSGGCGGYGGKGGKGGGGSFGIIINLCDNVYFENSKIKTLSGGKGGKGGEGGDGGDGGGRGRSGVYGGTAEQGDAGCGGFGGIGGKGGNGGSGGGGGGGPSVGIAYGKSTLFGVMDINFDIGKGGEGGDSVGKKGENGKSTEIIEIN